MYRAFTFVTAILGIALFKAGSLPAETPFLVEGRQSEVTDPSYQVGDGRAERNLPTVNLSPRPLDASARATSPVVATKDVSLDIQVPSLGVRTAGPDTLVVGKPSKYEVTLSNRGDFTAREIAVQISLPSWVRMQSSRMTKGDLRQEGQINGDAQLVWHVGQVISHAEERLSLMLVPTEGRAFDLTVDFTARPSSSTTQITVNEPKLQVSLTGPEDFVYGEIANFQVRLTNPGTGDAHQVTVEIRSQSDQLASLDIGTIPAGEKRTVDMRIEDMEAGVADVRAVAAGELGLKANATQTVLVRRAELQADLQGPSFEYSGAQEFYEVRIVNTGNADAENVAVNFVIPEGAARYMGDLPGVLVSPTGLNWQIERLAPGKESTLRLPLELNQGGDQKFVIKARSIDDLVAQAATVTHIQSVADLKLDVRDPKGPRPVGGDVVYEIQVTNRGTDVARQIYLVAVCAPEVETVDVTGNATIEAGQILFSPIQQLEPGRSIDKQVTVRASKAGSHLFRVMVQCDDPDTRLATEETTRFFVRPSSRQAFVPSILIESR
ncbi:MAG: hypothetical protein OES79_14175 [Planctomycetota bacterium]|nr:hypothetical protein [Planctomycetota bacterium]